MEKKFNNRRTANLGSGDFLVVHEGIQNHSDIQSELTEIINDLNNVKEESAHLSDVGCHLSFIKKALESLTQKCFDRHKAEQSLTLEQFNSLYPLTDTKTQNS